MKRIHILMVLLVNTLISIVVAVGLAYNDPQHWFEYLYSAFIFSHCIGSSIFVLAHFIGPRFDRLSIPVRLAATTGLFLVGGLIGTEVAIGILYFFLKASFAAAEHFRLIRFNLILSVIFGGVAWLYFSLRDRAQRLGAALREKELNEERLTRLKTKAELEALQTKVNPHFLFNTLNSIASLISENPKAAEETVEKLSDLFRHSLKHSEKDRVTLAEEFDLIRTYLEIEKMRLGDRLRYDIKCEDSVREIELPAMLIQPLVENSIKHGIAPAIGGGEICIDAREVGGNCVIMVRDSGKGIQDPNDSNGFGIRSIRERLKLIYGERAKLEIVQNDHCEILISLPIK